MVKMNGNLREDLFADLLTWEKTSQLVLALGTSMCGMNADRVARTCFERAAKGKAIGTVIINLQQTKMDACAALRIFAPLDEVLMQLAQELGYGPLATGYFVPRVEKLETGVFAVPYDSSGNKKHNGTTILDLREGATLRITSGPYAGAEGEMLGCNREGHFKLRCMVSVAKMKVKHKNNIH